MTSFSSTKQQTPIEDILNVDTILSEYVAQCTRRVALVLYSTIGLIGLLSAIAYIINLAATTALNTKDLHNYFLYLMFSCILIGSLVGMIVTFKYGSIDENIQILKQQNTVLAKDAIKFDELQLELGGNLQNMDAILNDLQTDSMAIANQAQMISALQLPISQTAGKNMHMEKSLTEMREISHGFHRLQRKIEKVHLLTIFYELEFRSIADAKTMNIFIGIEKLEDIFSNTKGNEKRRILNAREGLNEEEYELFLDRLDEETKNEFIKLGTFKKVKGLSNVLGINRFSKMIDIVLNNIESNEIEKHNVLSPDHETKKTFLDTVFQWFKA